MTEIADRPSEAEPAPASSDAPAPLAPDALSATLGMERIVAMKALDGGGGRATIEYRAGAHMCHSGGVVQGGFVTGWIDAAMAHAVIAAVGRDVVPMSLELKVSFYASARPGLVTAEAWIEKRGRTTAFCEGRLLDAGGKVLAKASSTLMLMDRSRVEGAARRAVDPG